MEQALLLATRRTVESVPGMTLENISESKPALSACCFWIPGQRPFHLCSMLTRCGAPSRPFRFTKKVIPAPAQSCLRLIMGPDGRRPAPAGCWRRCGRCRRASRKLLPSEARVFTHSSGALSRTPSTHSSCSCTAFAPGSRSACRRAARGSIFSRSAATRRSAGPPLRQWRSPILRPSMRRALRSSGASSALRPS